METVIAKTFAMILFFSNQQWGLFLPMLPEHNSMEACQESGKNLFKTKTDGSILAFFCVPLTVEQIAQLSNQPEHSHHNEGKKEDGLPL